MIKTCSSKRKLLLCYPVVHPSRLESCRSDFFIFAHVLSESVVIDHCPSMEFNCTKDIIMKLKKNNKNYGNAILPLNTYKIMLTDDF